MSYREYSRPYKEWHGNELAENMRQVDIDEVYASSGHTPLQAVLSSVELSDENFTFLHESKVVAIAGIREVNENSAVPWMLCSNAIEDFKKDYKKTFYKCTRQWVDDMNERYQMLFNYVDARNEVTIRWLKHLKFEFPKLIEDYGFEKIPFYLFMRVRHV